MDRTTHGHRRLIWLRGTLEATRVEAHRLTHALPEAAVLWVGPDGASRRKVRELLGRSYAAVVVQLHERLDANVLGQCHGYVVGGGALIVCAPDGAPPQEHLAAWGHDPQEVTENFWARLVATFGATASVPEPLQVPDFTTTSSPDQTATVEAIVAAARRIDAPAVVMTADRGRGKSAALGLAVRRIDGDIVVTAAGESAVAEVFEFAPPGRAKFVSPAQLLVCDVPCDVLLVDEAAQLPVALLRSIFARYEVPTVFSTTTHGYEGTGRGFTLRFVEELRAARRPLIEVELTTPIRWAANDPLEHGVFEALLLDAEPHPPAPAGGAVEHRKVPRAELARNTGLLREIFGLLIQAHYRTTPSDLHRLLDAPNLQIHASFADGHVVAATLVAIEGGLDRASADAVHDGKMRIVGHALPDTFAAHLGNARAAELAMIRSVRIATHAGLRRHGIATELVDHVHRSYAPDLFGTVFGATPELIAFRRSLGYEVVRLSASRGAESGAPSVVMVRPVTAAAVQLVEQLRADLARDLPAQLELFASDGVHLDEDLDEALRLGLDDPAPLDVHRRDEIVRHYAFGPRTLESGIVAVRAFVATANLDLLPADLRTLVVTRVVHGRSWTEAATAAQMSVGAAMRATRRAVRALIDTPAPR